MNPTMNSLLTHQHQGDLARTVSHGCRGYSEPPTRSDSAPTRWINLAHSALNQAKRAAPRTAHSSVATTR